jgi:hypothetical protein
VTASGVNASNKTNPVGFLEFHAPYLQELFDWLLQPSLDFADSKLPQLCKQTSIMLVNNLLNFYSRLV